jgi:triosephosphate isomerase
MSKKIVKGLIGGNWKCNGTVAQINSMVDVLNKAGSFSANSEVVIAGPSIHLAAMKAAFRPDIAVAAEDVGFKRGYGAYTGKYK